MSKRLLLVFSVSAFAFGLGVAFLKDRYLSHSDSVLKALPLKSTRVVAQKTLQRDSSSVVKTPESPKSKVKNFKLSFKNVKLDKGKIAVAGANDTVNEVKRRQAEKELMNEIERAKNRVVSSSSPIKRERG